MNDVRQAIGKIHARAAMGRLLTKAAGHFATNRRVSALPGDLRKLQAEQTRLAARVDRAEVNLANRRLRARA